MSILYYENNYKHYFHLLSNHFVLDHLNNLNNLKVFVFLMFLISMYCKVQIHFLYCHNIFCILNMMEYHYFYFFVVEKIILQNFHCYYLYYYLLFGYYYYLKAHLDFYFLKSICFQKYLIIYQVLYYIYHKNFSYNKYRNEPF